MPAWPSVTSAIKRTKPVLSALETPERPRSSLMISLHQGTSRGIAPDRRQLLKTGETSTEVSYALTSLTADQARPAQPAALIRNHWHIENRLHYVRDYSYDEDRCRV